MKRAAATLGAVVVFGTATGVLMPHPTPVVDVLPAAAFAATPDPIPQPVPTPIRKKSRTVPRCQDPLAVALAAAGWTGPENRVAWAIVMRESNGQPRKVAGPNDQDRGLWQLNRPAWGDEPWWDEQALLDESYNIYAARLVWEEYGFRPWGLTTSGDLDPTDYQRWTPEERDRWIMAPYRKWYDAYPCEVAPAAVRGES